MRQLSDTLDDVEVMPGVYDPRFVGESQRATATHYKDLHDARSKVDALREDIRQFKASHSIDGHCTVIYSGSVEAPSLLPSYETSEELLEALASNGDDFAPSLLYAVAACLEGCSFVNGASQGSRSLLSPSLTPTAAARSWAEWNDLAWERGNLTAVGRDSSGAGIEFNKIVSKDRPHMYYFLLLDCERNEAKYFTILSQIGGIRGWII